MGIFKSRSFRVDILTAFCTLLLTTFLAIIYYNYQTTSRIVLLLSDELMDRTTQSVIDQTVGFLAPPGRLIEATARLAAAGVVPFGDLAKLERFAIVSVRFQPQIAMFFMGNQAGSFIFARPDPDGKTVTKFIDRKAKLPKTIWKQWDPTLQVIKTETKLSDDFDPRLRPWYRGAAEKMGLSWTDLYIFYTSRQPGITVSAPVVDSQGNLAGVLGCDIELVQLSHFLASLKIGKRGLAFIINENQELVAYPDPTKVIANTGTTGPLRPTRVDSLDHPSVVAAHGTYLNTGREEFSLEVGKERYLASFTKFPASFGKPWIVAVVAPEDDFIGEVKDFTRRVLSIGLFFLALSVLLAVFLARRISKPILQLAAETDRIRKFQLEPPLELKSNITEVQILSEAINRMKISLRSFMRFAPEQLVREVVLGGRELMLGGDRRDVTLLFSDLRNFTNFAERTRPEEVVQILNVHFDAMVRIISDHRGYVVDFLGDSLFAVFGAPQADPDHAQQAIKCALTMQLTRHRLNEELTSPHLPRLEMGIGINSGSCIVGNMGSQVRIKYGVVGHAVNLAARIETFTVGGQVLISEATRLLTADQFSIRGPLEAYGKGVEGAITTWEVRGWPTDPAMTLPPTVTSLTPLLAPLPVRFRLITGKQIAPELYPAALIELSIYGAVLAADYQLDDFSAIQLHLEGPGAEPVHLDGKVVGVGASPRHYLIRFSPPDRAGNDALTHILAKHTQD